MKKEETKLVTDGTNEKNFEKFLADLKEWIDLTQQRTLAIGERLVEFLDGCEVVECDARRKRAIEVLGSAALLGMLERIGRHQVLPSVADKALKGVGAYSALMRLPLSEQRRWEVDPIPIAYRKTDGTFDKWLKPVAEFSPMDRRQVFDGATLRDFEAQVRWLRSDEAANLALHTPVAAWRSTSKGIAVGDVLIPWKEIEALVSVRKTRRQRKA